MFVFIFHNNVTIIAILLHACKKCHVAQSSILSWKVFTIVEQKKYVEVGNKTELFNAMHILRIFVKKLTIYD